MWSTRAISTSSLLFVALAACAHEETSSPSVTAAVTSLPARHDEATLRPPNGDAHREARRRLVRLHIAASPFPEVRAQADEVERRVLALGANVLSFNPGPPSRVWLDRSKAPMRGVLVRQDLLSQTATLVGYRGAAPSSVSADWQLRDALRMQVRGVSRPVTLCAPPEELDPTPCVAAEDVEIGSPVAYVDNDGFLRFVDRLPMRDAVSLAPTRERLELPVSVGARRVLSFELPLRYERPRDLMLSGSVAGAVGPHLVVKVDRRNKSRYVFDIMDHVAHYLAVIESPDLHEFHVASRGAPGAPGASDVAGGDGGPGGRGGDVDVVIDCGDASCGDAVSQLRRSVVSFGGPGGDGVLSGADGTRGKPGHVTIRALTPATNQHPLEVGGI